VDLFRFLFLTMTVRFGRGLANSATRLWYAPFGPVFVAAGIFLIATRRSPTSAVALFLTGSAIMHIQASMVERSPWKSLRNGAVLVVLFTTLLGWTTRDWIGVAVGAGAAVGLMTLHLQHEQSIAEGVRPRTVTG
jgi:high-affinity Fe2+/Pb2+ permease